MDIAPIIIWLLNRQEIVVYQLAAACWLPFFRAYAGEGGGQTSVGFIY